MLIDAMAPTTGKVGAERRDNFATFFGSDRASAERIIKQSRNLPLLICP
jgi:hypothetical protein